jgi:hypothetical protein
LAPIPGKFRTIILDPAWEYDWLSIAGRAKPGYAMQSHEELLALPSIYKRQGDFRRKPNDVTEKVS